MRNFWKIVNKVINESDIVLLVLDARTVLETRNEEIERKVRELKKPLIYVITKCDLVKKEYVDSYKNILIPSVFISAKGHFGISRLRQTILIEAKRAKVVGKKIVVGVLGYPNVGKSSMINSLKGRKSAPTSLISGYTKNIQKIRISDSIVLLDTPGVIPYQEKDKLKHAIIGSIDFSKTRDPDLIIFEIMKKCHGRIERHYEVEISEDPEETLERIARKRNILKRGGDPDTDRCARMILKDWQQGNFT